MSFTKFNPITNISKETFASPVVGYSNYDGEYFYGKLISYDSTEYDRNQNGYYKKYTIKLENYEAAKQFGYYHDCVEIYKPEDVYGVIVRGRPSVLEYFKLEDCRVLLGKSTYMNAVSRDAVIPLLEELKKFREEKKLKEDSNCDCIIEKC